MLLAKRAVVAANSMNVELQFLLRQANRQIRSPVSYSVISRSLGAEDVQTSGFHDQWKRSIHMTRVNRDLEAGLRSLGAGVAATGVVGSGVGVGLIFGNLMAAVARNPSISKQVFANAIMGAAFCESLGLFALAVAFTIMA